MKHLTCYLLLATCSLLAAPCSFGATIQSAPLGEVPLTTEIVTNGLATLNTQVEQISTYLNGEDARFVVTNYDSKTYLPEAYVEIKQSNEWLTVWKETTQLTNLEAQIEANARALTAKADLAWGQYDSSTGAAAPDGYTWISSSNTVFAGGLSWQKTLTSAGAVNVLTANGLTANVVGDTNGTFRVCDETGAVQWEIVRGSKVIVGASADGCTTTDTGLKVVYNVTAQSHPTMYFAASVNGPWVAEGAKGAPATSNWSGSSGAYTNDIACTLPALFAYGEYASGSEDYIHHALPTKLDSIMIGGKVYTIGTATVDGHTVLTLEAK